MKVKCMSFTDNKTDKGVTRTIHFGPETTEEGVSPMMRQASVNLVATDNIEEFDSIIPGKIYNLSLKEMS